MVGAVMEDTLFGRTLEEWNDESRDIEQKRESDGRYAFDGNLDRLCVCGHRLGDHSVGSPPDCLVHTMPEASESDKKCRCQKFRLKKDKHR